MAFGFAHIVRPVDVHDSAIGVHVLDAAAVSDEAVDGVGNLVLAAVGGSDLTTGLEDHGLVGEEPRGDDVRWRNVRFLDQADTPTVVEGADADLARQRFREGVN